MRAHEAAKKLVEVENVLVRLRDLQPPSGPERDMLNFCYSKIYEVGDSLYPKIIDEIREDRRDIMI